MSLVCPSPPLCSVSPFALTFHPNCLTASLPSLFHPFSLFPSPCTTLSPIAVFILDLHTPHPSISTSSPHPSAIHSALHPSFLSFLHSFIFLSDQNLLPLHPFLCLMRPIQFYCFIFVFHVVIMLSHGWSPFWLYCFSYCCVCLSCFHFLHFLFIFVPQCFLPHLYLPPL